MRFVIANALAEAGPNKREGYEGFLEYFELKVIEQISEWESLVEFPDGWTKEISLSGEVFFDKFKQPRFSLHRQISGECAFIKPITRYSVSIIEYENGDNHFAIIDNLNNSIKMQTDRCFNVYDVEHFAEDKDNADEELTYWLINNLPECKNYKFYWPNEYREWED